MVQTFQFFFHILEESHIPYVLAEFRRKRRTLWCLERRKTDLLIDIASMHLYLFGLGIYPLADASLRLQLFLPSFPMDGPTAAGKGPMSWCKRNYDICYCLREFYRKTKQASRAPVRIVLAWSFLFPHI